MIPIDLDIAAIRSQFPSLEPNSIRGPVYFDNPGGTQTPQRVIDAVCDYYRQSNANVGGAFSTSRRTTQMIYQARCAVAAFLNSAEPESIVFGNNMTSLTFHLARSIGDTIKPGDEIVVTDLDHDANIAPWLDLQAQGAIIRRVPFQISDCTLSMSDIEAAINERTRLVAITHASNAVGTIPDVKRVITLAHRVGALCFVDAVQYAPHRLIDVQELDCDFLVCSAYKFFGPHVGILYAKRQLLDELPRHKVRPAPETAPQCWETGTQNHEGIAGTLAAIEYLASVSDKMVKAGSDMRTRICASMLAIERYEALLAQQLVEGLKSIAGLRLYGITEADRSRERLCTVAFTWDRMSPLDTAEYLGDAGIYCWSGNYYALRIMETLGLQHQGGAVRIGVAHYNTSEEVAILLSALNDA